MVSRNINGIVISRRNIGEADRLLTIFSRQEGKIKIVARGSRRIKSKLSCHIEPFTIGEFSIVKGRTFDILTGAQCTEQFIQSANDLELIKDVSYILELLNGLLQENQHYPEIYDILTSTIEKMKKKSGPKREIYILFFSFKLLSLTGYSVDYTFCRDCGSPINEQNYYSVNYEGTYCTTCKTGKKTDKNIYKLLRLFNTVDVSKLSNIIYKDEDIMVLKKIIKNYTSIIYPAEIKSENL